MDTATFLLIAQVTSAITSILGIIAIYLTFRAAKGLLAGDFKNLIKISGLFLIVVVIGVISMTLYHLMEGNEIAEKAELIWYTFIYISLIFSLYESYRVIKFGKFINKPNLKAKKKRKK